MTIPSTRGEIIWRVHFRSPPTAVFELLATDEGRQMFWAEEAVERDGAIHFVFVNGIRTVAPILGERKPDRFDLEYFGSYVRFDLEPDGVGGTDLTLVNRGVDASMCRCGLDEFRALPAVPRGSRISRVMRESAIVRRFADTR